MSGCTRFRVTFATLTGEPTAPEEMLEYAELHPKWRILARESRLGGVPRTPSRVYQT
jgi:hypothetical protein